MKIETTTPSKINSLQKIRQELQTNNPNLGFKVKYSIPIEGDYDEFKDFFKTLFSGQINNIALTERNLIIEYEGEGSLDNDISINKIKEKAKIDLTKVFEIYASFIEDIETHNKNSDNSLNEINKVIEKKQRISSIEDKLNPFI